jgi:hypothetical protein
VTFCLLCFVPILSCQAELDDLLASDCPICGIPAIRELSLSLPELEGGPKLWELPMTQ